MREYFDGNTETDKERQRWTVILTVSNRKTQLQDTLQWLGNVDGISNIIIVDNGSEDGTAEWASTQQYEYVWFDEGVQGYGILWNTVLCHFEVEEYIIFIEAGVYPEQRCLCELAEALQMEDVEIVSPVTNCFMQDKNNRINNRDGLLHNRLYYQGAQSKEVYRHVLCANWKIWAARRGIFDRNGAFDEHLSQPEDVLTDYSLRLIQNERGQLVCRAACAFESFVRLDEIYVQADQWRNDDHIFMKQKYDMNYFNLIPNRFLAECIREDEDKVFKVLEIGCDLGANLFGIRNDYPKCEVYGLEINEAAVKIAKHIANVKCGNIDELQNPFQEKFDYIVFGDVLEHLHHPEEVVRLCWDMLDENGCIIASIPNVMHISVMEELIDGRFRYSDTGLLDRTHIHFFTYREIMELFLRSGYIIKYLDGITFHTSERQKQLKKVLLELSDETEDWMYETFQYIIKAQKQK